MSEVARRMGNFTLQSDLEYDKLSLSHLKDMDLIGICNSLSKLTADHISSLNKQGITVENIAELQRLTSVFSINLGRTRSARIKSKSMHEKLRKLYRESDELLKNRLDQDIEFFKHGEPGFYQEYLAARIIFEDNADMGKVILKNQSVFS